MHFSLPLSGLTSPSIEHENTDSINFSPSPSPFPPLLPLPPLSSSPIPLSFPLPLSESLSLPGFGNVALRLTPICECQCSSDVVKKLSPSGDM